MVVLAMFLYIVLASINRATVHYQFEDSDRSEVDQLCIFYYYYELLGGVRCTERGRMCRAW